MRWAAILVAVLLTLAVPAAGDQRPDGFGGRNTYRGPYGDRDCDALGTCQLDGHAVGPKKQVYEVWTCEGGQIILWPTSCFDDPTQPPCKES